MEKLNHGTLAYFIIRYKFNLTIWSLPSVAQLQQPARVSASPVWDAGWLASLGVTKVIGFLLLPCNSKNV
jgi:hypothetical protein